MSSQLLTSVMEESYNFLHGLIKLSQCSKRNQKPISPIKYTVSARKKKDAHYDSDDTLASTEPGENSNNEFSDKSHQTDGSTGRSGSRSAGHNHGTRRVDMRGPGGSRGKGPVRPPPGLDVPPGLECPWNAPTNDTDRVLNALGMLPAWKQPETRLNADAVSFVPFAATAQRSESGLNPESPCFVPSLGAVASAVDQGLSQGFSPEFPQKSQQLRQSIQMLKGALEEWEANLPAPSIPAAQHHLNAAENLVEAQPGENLVALQEALTKLTPEQAFMMRTFLDKKVSSENTTSLIKDAVQQGVQKGPFTPAARSHPAGMQRSFTPFGGTHAPWDQVKPAKVPFLPGMQTAPKNTSQAAGFDESLKDHLHDLAELETARVLMVRKINRLGLDSPPLLKEYFARFGNVERVMVAHTRCKVKGLEKGRVRPAPLGFVVMGKPEDASAALAQGPEHSVHGVDIGVYSFESHPAEDLFHRAEEDERGAATTTEIPPQPQGTAESGLWNSDIGNTGEKARTQHPCEESMIEKEQTTTLMIYDLPLKLSIEQLIDMLDNNGFAKTFDLVYMPPRKGCAQAQKRAQSNVGFAFINFKAPKYAASFAGNFCKPSFIKDSTMFTFPDFSKPSFVKVARYQGYEANMKQHTNGSIVKLSSQGSLITFRDCSAIEDL